MDKKIELTLSSADGVLPDEKRDDNAIRNINEWLEPLIPELNNAGITANLYLDENGIQHLTFSSNITEDLLYRAKKELERYRFRLRF